MRLVGSEALHAALAAVDGALIDDPVMANGRIELRHLLREQSLSVAYHRYGNCGGGPPAWLGLGAEQPMSQAPSMGDRGKTAL